MSVLRRIEAANQAKGLNSRVKRQRSLLKRQPGTTQNSESSQTLLLHQRVCQTRTLSFPPRKFTLLTCKCLTDPSLTSAKKSGKANRTKSLFKTRHRMKYQSQNRRLTNKANPLEPIFVQTRLKRKLKHTTRRTLSKNMNANATKSHPNPIAPKHAMCAKARNEQALLIANQTQLQLNVTKPTNLKRKSRSTKPKVTN